MPKIQGMIINSFIFILITGSQCTGLAQCRIISMVVVVYVMINASIQDVEMWNEIKNENENENELKHWHTNNVNDVIYSNQSWKNVWMNDQRKRKRKFFFQILLNEIDFFSLQKKK